MTIKTTVKAGNKTLFVNDFEFIPAVGDSFYSHGTKYIVLDINQADEHNATLQVSAPPAQGVRAGGQHAYKTPKGGR
jgi:hypothetical protein